jgi:hypothetical protein
MEYLIGLVVIVSGAMLLRKYRYSRLIKFSFEGERYIKQPDGSFTYRDGRPVLSPEAERVSAYWDEISKIEIS